MSDAMPMICKCALHQGGGPAWLEEIDANSRYAARVFGPDCAMAQERAPITVEPEPVTPVARWALNLPPVDVVIENLAEPTRREFQE